MQPEKIGRYEIKAELGQGGMATVFHAYDPRFERDVAVKVLPQALLHDPQFKIRFEREAKTIAALEHPSIVPVYDFGEDEGQPYIVMRLMSGGTLTDRLENGPIEYGPAVTIINRMAMALDAAHKKGIIHRDLKPGNILFDQYGNAFLSDFGIARMTGSGPTLTGSQIIGTPAYMSPEQVQGGTSIDSRSDIYALGVILYQMLTNQMPYDGDTPAKVMMMHILEPVPEINQVDPELPEGCNGIIQKSMAKDPGDRYQTAAEMSAALKTAVRMPPGSEQTQLSSPDEKKTVVTPLPAPTATQVSTGDTKPPVVAATAAAVPAATPAPAAPPAAAPGRKSGSSLKIILPIVLILGAIIIIGGGLLLTGTQGSGPLAFLAGDQTTPTATERIEPSPEPTQNENPVVEPTDPLPVQASPTIAATQAPQPTEVPTDVPTEAPTEIPSPTPEPTSSAPVLGGADKVAFVHQNDIWVSNLDGTDLRQLTVDGGEKYNLHWTSDGKSVAYTVGKCAKWVEWETGREDIIACFEVAEFLEGFEISPDMQQVAFSLNRELFVVPFDVERLQQARFRSDLIEMNECPVLGPYTSNAVKSVHWSSDMNRLAFVFLGAVDGLQKDLIRVADISSCEFKPQRLDEFPASRFTMRGYEQAPVIQNFGWDGLFLYGLNGFTRNGGFGDLYIYNGDSRKADQINPMDGVCCYRDMSWSPDGRYITFAFQDIGLGSSSVSEIYIIPVGTVGTGVQYAPLPLPDEFLTNPKERPQPILRPASP